MAKLKKGQSCCFYVSESYQEIKHPKKVRLKMVKFGVYGYYQTRLQISVENYIDAFEKVSKVNKKLQLSESDLENIILYFRDCVRKPLREINERGRKK